MTPSMEYETVYTVLTPSMEYETVYTVLTPSMEYETVYTILTPSMEYETIYTVLTPSMEYETVYTILTPSMEYETIYTILTPSMEYETVYTVLTPNMEYCPLVWSEITVIAYTMPHFMLFCIQSLFAYSTPTGVTFGIQITQIRTCIVGLGDITIYASRLLHRSALRYIAYCMTLDNHNL